MVDVESYITENGLDEKAANALRAEDESVVSLVMAGGGFDNVRNKSAVIIGRIRKAKVQGAILAKGSNVTVDPAVLDEFLSQEGVDERAAQELRAEEPAIIQAVLEAGPLTDAKNKSAAIIGRIGKAKKGRLFAGGLGGGGGLKDAVEKFLQDNDVDEKAANELRNENHAVKRMVLEEGGLDTANNKSAVVMQRIRRAKGKVGDDKKGGSGGGFSEMDMMMAMQAGAMQAMGGMGGKGGGMPGMGEMMMMEMMMMSEMMAAGGMMGGKGGKGGMGGMMGAMMGGSSDVQKFLMQNGVDSRASAELLSEPKAIQMAVINGGSLKDANNPSAALVGRIKNAKIKARSSPY